MNKFSLLAEEYFSTIDNSVINEIVLANSYNKELVFSSYEWSDYLKNYLVLTHMPSIIKSIQLDSLSLFMNRYYWLKKFYHNYSLTQGIDVGVEQQIVQLIEAISNQFKDFDWAELEKIDTDIERH